MTIDEGIKNLEYGTKQLEMEIESGLWIKGSESELCCKEGIALNKQYIEWLTELKEAKRLLKLAVNDLNEIINTRHDNSQWRYADEAIRLIGENTDETNT